MTHFDSATATVVATRAYRVALRVKLGGGVQAWNTYYCVIDLSQAADRARWLP